MVSKNTKSKAVSDMFEARYLQAHPKKFDSQRAALLKRLGKKKNESKKR